MPTLELLGATAVRQTITVFRDAVRDHAAAINRLNVYPVPDGDTGTNMARTLDAVVAELETAGDDMTSTCKAISHGSLMGARGNSGVILSQILRGVAGVFEQAGDATGPVVARALTEAAAAAYNAVLKPIEGTILTVVRQSAVGAEEAAGRGATLVEVLQSAQTAGRQALASTPDLLPVLKDAGVVDAGGAGFMLLLDAALNVVDGEAMPEADDADDTLDAAAADRLAAVAHRGDGDVSELRYEVMYFMDLADEHIDDFKQAWGQIGDSIVVVGGDGLWNCHVHTDDIGAAIESALANSGRPKQIRVTDLFEEIDAEHARREAAIAAPGPIRRSNLPAVTTAVVAVAVGQGLVELFGQLGVQGVVTGGQTMNPSTAELLDAVDRVNAEEVILLPNNSNIIPVAEQVDALSTKTVRVVPTRSMAEALGALIVYDPEASADANAAEMATAAASVDTGEVTQAIRDTKSPVGLVTSGDWIGLVRGDGIVSIGGSLVAATIGLLEHLCGDDRELVTLILGEGATRETTDAILGWLAEERPDIEVEVHRGGQPLYPYLFGVE